VHKTTFLDSSGFQKQVRKERKGANYTTTEETSDHSLMQQPADFRDCVHKSRLDFRRNDRKEDTTKQQRLQDAARCCHSTKPAKTKTSQNPNHKMSLQGKNNDNNNNKTATLGAQFPTQY
jgi:hypothetical protein